MPTKSKKSQAAARREAEKKQTKTDLNKNAPANEYEVRYRPVEPSCQPYWDAFYKNPYPSDKECQEIAAQLNHTPELIRQWFKMARRYTHAPEMESNFEVEGKEEEGDGNDDDVSDLEEDKIEATLYAYFYRDVTKNGPLKRKRSSALFEVSEGDSGSTKARKLAQTDRPHPREPREPRAPITRASRTTVWRNRKHASDIRRYFTTVKPTERTVAESPVLEPVLTRLESNDESDIQHICDKPTTNNPPEQAGDFDCQKESLACVAQQVDGDVEQDTHDAPPPPDLPLDIPTPQPLMTIEAYEKALDLLENSLDRLKIGIYVPAPGPITLPEPSRQEQSANQNVDQGTPEAAPTVEDAEKELTESMELLEGLAEGSGISFYEDLDRHLRHLLSEEKKSKVPDAKRLIELTTLSDYNNLRKIYLDNGHSSPSTVASNEIAKLKFTPSATKMVYKGESWYARRLRAKANHVVRYGCLPISNQGKGAAHYSLLCEEDVKQSIQAYMRSIKVGTISPARLRREVNQNVLPALGITALISESTAKRWLAKLGYRPVQHRKGLYMDGHERDDVVEYRKEFLKVIKSLQPLIQQYDDVTNAALPLILPPETKRHIPVGHDESCFHANDRKSVSWLQEGEQQLRQKGRGRVIHVSDFIVEDDGDCACLALTEAEVKLHKRLPKAQQLSVTDARKIIEPGKNHDKWWDMDQLCEQLEDAVKIFDAKYPNCVALFFFDQSSAHNAFADDALVAKQMNVGPGGKSVKPMHETTIPMDNPNPALRGKPQSMVFPPGHERAGQPKGMRIVLEERGLLGALDRNRNGQAVGVCASCQLSEEAQAKAEKEAQEQMAEDPEFFKSLEDTGLDSDSSVPRSTTCCMRRCLSMQHDFLNEKPRIQILIEQAGHWCLFLPKFHCELNPIEMYWGYAKRLFREQSDGTLLTARKLVPQCLNACSAVTIRHFWRKTWRYMDAYMHGLTGRQAEFAVRKYKSHRCVGVTVMNEALSIPN